MKSSCTTSRRRQLDFQEPFSFQAVEGVQLSDTVDVAAVWSVERVRLRGLAVAAAAAVAVTATAAESVR